MPRGRTDDPDHRIPCEERECDVVSLVLVDERGWVLLQERDEHAPTYPLQWGLVGGHVEAGEDFRAAIDRELLEETGLRPPPGALSLWYDGAREHVPKSRPGLVDRWQVWVGGAWAPQEAIVLGEGRQIVHVDPARLGDLDVVPSSAELLDELLASEDYRRLT